MTGNSATMRTRAVLARIGNGTNAGTFHVIAPADCLLDLEALGAHLGGEIETVAAEPLEQIASLPGSYEHAIVFDNRLNCVETLELTDDAGATVPMSDVEFHRLVDDARHYDFCVPCQDDPTSQDRSADRASITHTLTRFTQLRMRERLDETISIPPLPEAARRMLALRTDPDYEVRELIRIVEADPSLSARLLGWANSAFYSLRDPVTSIADAITRVLGPDVVLNMSLAITLKQDLKLPAGHVRGLSPYWLEAMYTAATMEALANQLPLAHRRTITTGFAYVSGLLANFGTLVLGHVFPPFYARICRQQEANRHLAHTFVDQQTIGTARELFAAALLETWGLPDCVVDAVRFQYAERYTGANAGYIALLRVTHQLLAPKGLSDAPSSVSQAANGLAGALDLDARTLARVMEVITDATDALDEMARVASA
jgi:HD-like signal output (HDOD) protein